MEFSLRYPPVQGRLHTRYAPVRRSSAQYCYRLLPLDLHVLSLPLAFILSQDQTLHCKNCFVLPFDSSRVAHISIYVCRHTLSLSSHPFQITLAFFQPPFFRRKRMQRYNLFPIRQNIFSEKCVSACRYCCITASCIGKKFSSRPVSGSAKRCCTGQKRRKIHSWRPESAIRRAKARYVAMAQLVICILWRLAARVINNQSPREPRRCLFGISR